MDRIDRYILRKMAGPFFGAFIGVLALLMLERMLRVIQLVEESNGAIRFVFDMLASLAPHYLGMALPAGLFVASYVAYRRLAETSELAALASLGRGLGRLARPAFLAALALTMVSIAVHSHFQPHGRYAYRTLKVVIANASVASALEAGAFIQFGDVTLMAERPADSKGALGRVFVHERRDDGASRTITSGSAALIETADGSQTTVRFIDGLLVDTGADGERAVISFDQFDWPVDRSTLGELQPRGLAESELTLPELYRILDAPPERMPPERVASEFHTRTVKALTVMLAPLLAIPLAAMGGRTRTALPLALGVVTMLVYIQSLQFLESFADLGLVPAAPALWAPFILMAAGSGYLFLRVWRQVGFEPAIGRPVRRAFRRRRRRVRTA